MNYFLTAAALKAASTNAVTQRAYRALTRLRSDARDFFIDQAEWTMEGLPDSPQRLLDLGTGWVHAYSLYPWLTRDDELHAFDTEDNRNWASFVATVPVILKKILEQPTLSTMARLRANDRAHIMLQSGNFSDAYTGVRGRPDMSPSERLAACMVRAYDKRPQFRYQCRPDGVPQYPDNYFHRIFSIDVLEHVNRWVFPEAAKTWFRILRPGGTFVAQVGLDDHLAFYQGKFGSKRYMRYSPATWRLLLGNTVQYIDRFTSSEIVALLVEAGFVITSAEVDKSGDTAPEDVHPAYDNQSADDIRAVRLSVLAEKPA